MTRTKLLALLAVFALFAAACGGSDGDSGDDTAATTDDTTDVDAGDDAAGDDAGDDAGDAAGDDAGDDAGDEDPVDDAMDDEDPVAASAAGTGGQLDLLQWQAPSTANALLSGGTKDLLAGSIVIEPFARFNPAGELVATLAAEIPSATNGGLSEDQTQITWKIKEGIVWSDGTPFTADDAVFTWEYCADLATGCSTDSFTTVTNVVADDDLTVTVTFDAPQPFPFVPFVGYANPIIQRAQFADCVGAASTSCSDENFGPIGTGPYMVVELRPEDTVSYAFNPLFRGNADGQPFFENVIIKGGGDAEASARSVLEIGEADYAWNLQVAPEILGPMEDAGLGEVVVAFATNVEHINLNQTDNRADGDLASNWADGTNPNPFFANNSEFARALSLAINRDDLVTVGYGPTGIPTCNMWNVGAGTSTNNDECLVQDIAEANSILDGLGYLDTDDDGVRELPDGTPLEFSYATSTNAVRQSNQDLIKDNWEEIGVIANMENVDASLFFGESTGDQSIWRFPWDIEMFTNGPSAGPDAQNYMGNFRTSEIPTPDNAFGPGNISRLASDEFDALFAEFEQTALDDPARNDQIIQLNDIVTQGGSIIPLILRGSVSAFSNNMENTGPLNGWGSEYWNIEEWTRSE